MKTLGFVLLILIFTTVFVIGESVAQYSNVSSFGLSIGERNFENSLKSYFSDTNSDKMRLNSIEKEPVSEPWKMKCSSRLLQIVDNSTISSGMSMESIKSQLISQQLYIPANSTTMGGLSTETDIIFLEISIHPSSELQNISPYIFEIIDKNNELGILVAYVPVEQIQALAMCDEVISLKIVSPAVINVGSVTTEGDSILHASEVRLNTPFRGNGVKVGVISDSIDHLAESQARGDLPYDVHVLRNAHPFSHTDEGIALLEIIHDIAPGAELYFHDGGGTSTGFITALDALSNAGCDIICDDLNYPDQPYFEDGAVATHIKGILNLEDIIFITAAGNDADLHYQGFFYDPGDGFHDFSRGGDPIYKELYFSLDPGGYASVYLQWNDKWGESNNDYDMGLFDLDTDEFWDISADIQNGDDNPVEVCYIQNIYSHPIDIGILVERVGNSLPKTLEVFIFPDYRGYVYSENIIPSDSIYGHPAVNEVISVGAIDSQDPGHDTIELYSSQGPVTIVYPSSESRKKPDICGIDNVRVTGVGGFGTPFFGTSASAPHIAGIVALVWSANPSLSASEVRSALLSSADDLSWPGWDSVFGYGRANAQNMYALIPTTQPTTSPPTTQPTTSQPTTQPTTSPPTTQPTTSLPTTQPTTSPPTTQPTTSLPTTLFADFTASKTSGVAPLTVHFQDISQGDPTGWMWDINGDGFLDYSYKSFEHTYTSPGYYSVTYSITRNQELVTISRPDYIHVLSGTPTTDAITLDLHTGWNLISTPKTLADGHRTRSEVFSGINTAGHSIYRYNAHSQSWIQLNSNDEIDPLQGIWIYSATSAQIPLVFRDDPISSTAELSLGWNCIGFSQVDPVSAKDALFPVQNAWTQLLGFNAESQLYETSIINGGSGTHSETKLVYPGKGYWIFMNNQGTLS